MQVQINAHRANVPAHFVDGIEERVQTALAPFAEQITRVEVHFQDQNAGKGGLDKRCAVEARPQGMDPIAGEALATDESEALRLALNKLRHALDHRIGKRAARQRGA